VDSARQRLRRVVMGGSKESMNCFRRGVGKKSRAQVELEEDMIIARTS